MNLPAAYTVLPLTASFQTWEPEPPSLSGVMPTGAPVERPRTARLVTLWTIAPSPVWTCVNTPPIHTRSPTTTTERTRPFT